MEEISALNLFAFAIALVGLLFGIFGMTKRSLETKINAQEADKQARDRRSITTLYQKHDDLAIVVKDLKEKIADKYWTREDVREHLASNNQTFKIILEAHGKTFQTKLDHVEKTTDEIKVLLTDILRRMVDE